MLLQITMFIFDIYQCLSCLGNHPLHDIRNSYPRYFLIAILNDMLQFI
jgi:hypothetical protein